MAARTSTKEELPDRKGMIQAPNGEWLFILNQISLPGHGKMTPMKFNRLMQLKQPNMNKVLEELKKVFPFPTTLGIPTDEVETLHFKIFFFEAVDESGG